MEQNKKMSTSLSGRLIYAIFSGLLFLILGIVIFVRAKGFRNFFSAGLFAILISGYGIYRIFMFLQLLKKEKEETK